MSQICRVCNLDAKSRKNVERQLLQGRSKASIGREFGVSKNSLAYHQKHHLAPAVLAGVRRSDENHGVKLLEDLDDLVITSRRILRKAEEDGHSSTALKAIKETRSSIVSIAQISHAIWSQQQNEASHTIEMQENESILGEGFKKSFEKLPKERQQIFKDILIQCMGESTSGETGPEPEEEEEQVSSWKSEDRPPVDPDVDDEDENPPPSTGMRRTRY